MKITYLLTSCRWKRIGLHMENGNREGVRKVDSSSGMAFAFYNDLTCSSSGSGATPNVTYHNSNSNRHQTTGGPRPPCPSPPCQPLATDQYWQDPLRHTHLCFMDLVLNTLPSFTKLMVDDHSLDHELPLPWTQRSSSCGLGDPELLVAPPA